MYVLSNNLQQLPIISLQTGEQVGLTQGLIFDMGALELVAFTCAGDKRGSTHVLMSRDIRETAPDCLIIDSEDEIADADDIVRLKDLLKTNFNPIGKPVMTEGGRRQGAVEDFTINLETYRLQKLYVRQSILRSWLGSSLIIDRSQIVDVTPQKIIVREAVVKQPLLAPKPMPDSQP